MIPENWRKIVELESERQALDSLRLRAVIADTPALERTVRRQLSYLDQEIVDELQHLKETEGSQ